MNKNVQGLINAAEMRGAAEMAVLLGLSSGEITMRQARDTYKKWFIEAYAAGRIKPVRIEGGARQIKYFSVVQILALKEQDYANAELK